MTTELTVANTILEQLGGRRFLVMTGAKNLLGDDTSLTFRLPGGGFCKDGINCVRITLNPTDTYTVEFLRVHGAKVAPVTTRTDIYNDQLAAIFTRETGLATRL